MIPLKLSIFGVTGSIGQSALRLIAQHKTRFTLDTISAHTNIEALAEAARIAKPRHIVLRDPSNYAALRACVPDDISIEVGEAALSEAAARKVDIVLNAIIGAAGLPISIKAAQSAKRLALANKESLVIAGPQLLDLARKSGCEIIPVDSEHSAIFQALLGQDRKALSRVLLTASGGPFRRWTQEQMAEATLGDALAHPTWDMGQRITIDSASMFNKALEMIEARVLFDLDPDQIDVVIHPQSIIHSAVEFVDGGQIAQMGHPDMSHAIGFALGFPARIETGVKRLDWTKMPPLEFEAVDEARFPAIRLARLVMHRGGGLEAVLNAAKEVALDRFIAGELGFLEMAHLVENVIGKITPLAGAINIEDLYLLDQQARDLARAYSVQTNMHLKT